MNTPRKFNIQQWLRSRTGLTLLVFLAIAAFFLIAEHRAHVYGILPYALLLLALLVFLFVRREQVDNDTHKSDQTEDRK